MSNISAPPRLTKSNEEQNIDEIDGYMVITKQDPDILNQGTIQHIKYYFDQKQRQDESSQRKDTEEQTLSRLSTNRYSINSISFMIKLMIFIIFICIVCDFIKQK